MNVLISPSSIFPAISGQAGGAFPNGYTSVQQKEALLATGSGLFTGNFADYEQERSISSTGTPPGLPLSTQGFTGKGINKYYTSPKDYKFGNYPNGDLYGSSGIFITYPPNSGGPEWESYKGSKGSGIFNFKDFISNFSNASNSRERASGIYDFTIFNDYIHYLPFAEQNNLEEETNIVGGEGANSIEVRIPFVADLIPTSQIWDRYGTQEEEQEEDGTDPDYGTDNGNTETTGDEG